MLPPGGCRAAEALLPTAQDRPSVANLKTSEPSPEDFRSRGNCVVRLRGRQRPNQSGGERDWAKVAGVDEAISPDFEQCNSDSTPKRHLD